MKRLILYDLDGTLVDTKEDIASAANHMLDEMGAPPLSREEICRFVGGGLLELVSRCLKTNDPDRVKEGVAIYRVFYSQHLLDRTRLYPGAREVLEHFQNSAQVVLTNKPNPYSREILTALGVAGFFKEIIAGNSGYAKKPDPEAVLHILKKETLSPEEALFVGDSPIDVETGRSAGVFTIAVAHGFFRREELRGTMPDALVRDFKELLKLIGRNGW